MCVCARARARARVRVCACVCVCDKWCLVFHPLCNGSIHRHAAATTTSAAATWMCMHINTFRSERLVIYWCKERAHARTHTHKPTHTARMHAHIHIRTWLDLDCSYVAGWN